MRFSLIAWSWSGCDNHTEYASRWGERGEKLEGIGSPNLAQD